MKKTKKRMITLNVDPENLVDDVNPQYVKDYNEAEKAGKGKEFIYMLLTLVINSRYFEEQEKDELEEKRRARDDKKARIVAWEKYLESLGIEEWAKTINTEYQDLPKEVQAMYPYTIPKYKESFDDFRILGRVKKNSRQKEIFAARFVKYLKKNGYVSSDEYGDHVHYKRVAEDVNRYMVQYDLPARKGLRAQYVRVSERGIKNYCTQLTTPKRSRFSGIAQALDIPEVYLAGYLNWKFDEGGQPIPTNKVA